jgi:hypothetical protein
MIVLRLSQPIDEISLKSSKVRDSRGFQGKCFQISLSGQPYFRRLSVCNPFDTSCTMRLPEEFTDPKTSYLAPPYTRTHASEACRHIPSDDLLREASSFHPMETPHLFRKIVICDLAIGYAV